MAGMAGLEPAMRESKSRALTAWLHPTIIRLGQERKSEGPKPKLRPFRHVWGGRRDSNPRHSEPQSDALPTELRPPYAIMRTIKGMVRLKGLEPLTHCLEGSCSIHLSYRRISCAPWGPRVAVPQATWGKEGQRNERAFGGTGSEGCDACPDAGAGDGNRTHATSLEGWDSTIELHPHGFD